MKRHSLTHLFAAFALSCITAAAQDFSIPWSTSDAGGGTSTGGSFTLSGTIAQTDAAAPAQDAAPEPRFTLSAGFWAISILAEPGPLYAEFAVPHEDHGEALLTLWWLLPQPAGTVLERSTDLENWEVIRFADIETQHIVPESETRGFFRLRTPEP